MLLSGALDPTRSRVVGVTGPESDSQAARCKSVCIRVCTHVRAAISTVRALHGAVGADALVANPTACSEIVCPARVRIRRLHPGDDLRQSLLTIITKYYAMDAAVVLTCVGNLRKCRVKFASSQISSGSVPPSPMAKSGANNSPFARDTQVENAGASMSGEHADAAGNSDRDSPTSVESGDNVWNQRMGSFHGGPMPLHSPSTSLTRAHGTADLFQREDEVLEIVSLVGTLSGGESGDCNLNIALADRYDFHHCPTRAPYVRFVFARGANYRGSGLGTHTFSVDAVVLPSHIAYLYIASGAICQERQRDRR